MYCVLAIMQEGYILTSIKSADYYLPGKERHLPRSCMVPPGLIPRVMATKFSF